MTLTKQDLKAIERIVDTKIGVVDGKVTALQSDMLELRSEIRGLREQIQQLAITLDNFVKMMTDYRIEKNLSSSKRM